MNWLHIDNWLTTVVYKNHEKIPEFERNTKNYDLLNNLKNLDVNSTELVDKVLSSLDNNHTSDYHLSTSGHDALHSLATTAQLLGLDKTELSNYFTAITKVSLNGLELNLEESSLDDIEYKLNESQLVVNEELHHMKNVLSNLKQNASRDDSILKRKLEKGTMDGSQLKKITSEYLSLQSKYNTLEIERKGIRLTHLQELDEKANTIELELKEKNQILTTYQGLPSEMVLASIKIQETQDRLHELESEREHLLSDIAKSVLS